MGRYCIHIANRLVGIGTNRLVGSHSPELHLDAQTSRSARQYRYAVAFTTDGTCTSTSTSTGAGEGANQGTDQGTDEEANQGTDHGADQGALQGTHAPLL
jgi:hypothetical protein